MRYMVAVDGKEAAKKAVGNHILVAFHLHLSPINTLQDFVLKLVKVSGLRNPSACAFLHRSFRSLTTPSLSSLSSQKCLSSR